MKLFFVTPHFILFLSLAFCVIFSIPTTHAQSDSSPLTFSAVLHQNQVNLTWNNRTEDETDYFKVERSLDGRHWETIEQIEGLGFTDDTFQYQATDAAPYEGVVYYRLEQIDYDGQALISPAVEVLYEVSMDQFFMSQDKAVAKMRKSY